MSVQLQKNMFFETHVLRFYELSDHAEYCLEIIYSC